MATRADALVSADLEARAIAWVFSRTATGPIHEAMTSARAISPRALLVAFTAAYWLVAGAVAVAAGLAGGLAVALGAGVLALGVVALVAARAHA